MGAMREDEELEAGLPEDPTDVLERDLAGRVARDASEVLASVAQSITPANAARLLDSIESAASSYSSLIQVFTVGAEPRGLAAPAVPLSATLGGGLETFGAQAIQQVVAAIKGFGSPPERRRRNGHALEIDRLTAVLMEMRRGGSSRMEPLAAKIEARINKLLDDEGGEIEEDDDDAAYLLPPGLVRGLPVGDIDAEFEPVDLDGLGPDAGGGGAADEVHPQGAEEGLD